MAKKPTKVEVQQPKRVRPSSPGYSMSRQLKVWLSRGINDAAKRLFISAEIAEQENKKRAFRVADKEENVVGIL